MKIEALSAENRESLKNICQKLFHQTFITEFVFSPNDEMKRANVDYTFAVKFFAELEEVMDSCGWKLCKDERMGMLYLTSSFAEARQILNQTESLFLLALRILYDDNRMNVYASGEAVCCVREIIECLTSLNAISHIAKQDRAAALKTLAKRNIISRLSGDWKELDTRIVILPSVSCAISAEKIAEARNSLLTEETPLEEKSSEETEVE